MIYLDNAATTYPKPETVYREADRVLRSSGNPGRGGHRLAMAAAEELYLCREAVADLFDGQPDRVVFTANATGALNLALSGLLAPGDHVLTSALAHNSVRRPLAALAGKGVAVEEYPVFPHKERIVDAIARLLRPNTRAVEVTVRSNICSIGLPVEEIAALCKQKGIYLIIDAAQAAGAREISLKGMGKAVLCAPGHKGLYGIPGSGFALFSKEADPLEFTPLLLGGSGQTSRMREMPADLPERLEAGTQNAPAAAALRAGIGEIRAIGLSEIDERECALRRRLTDWLSAIRGVQIYCPEGEEGSIVLFRLQGRDAEQVADLLDRRGIALRAGLHCAPDAHRLLGTPKGGALRASMGLYTTEADLLALCRTLREIAHGYYG